MRLKQNARRQPGVRTTKGHRQPRKKNSTISAAAVRAAIAPDQFYRRELRDMPRTHRAGWVNGGLCPFHEDHHAGSFRVNLESGGFFCHACEVGGRSVIDFIMERDGLSLSEATRTLAQSWGVSI